jgi:hypothetical protein
VAKAKRKRTALKPEYHPGTVDELVRLADALDPLAPVKKAISDMLSGKPSLPLPPGVKRSYIASDEEAARYDPPPPASPSKPTGAGIWLTDEVRRLKANHLIPEGIIKTNYASLLADRMKEAGGDSKRVRLAGTNKYVRIVSASHILNSLSEWGLWPI